MTELDEILDRLDIESYLDFIGADYKSTSGRSGPQFQLKECPSCGGASWKVYVSQETGLGSCFHGGCELGKFNKWSFVKACMGGNPANREIFQHLKQFSSQLGWRPKKKAVATTVERPDLILPTSIKLPDVNGNIPLYLSKRGVTAELCQYFQLSYCHEGYFWYRDTQGEQRRQDYSNRIIIPFFGLQGDLVGFQGRDVTGTADIKYMFPPQIASAGTHLYNGQNAWGAERLVIGEGAFDVISIRAALDEEVETRDVAAIGTFGMHLSAGTDGNSQVMKLRQLREAGLKHVTFMWDGEQKAIKAALEQSLMLSRIGFKVRVALLPPNKDPNEVLPSVVRECFYHAVDPTTNAGLMKIMRRIA